MLNDIKPYFYTAPLRCNTTMISHGYALFETHWACASGTTMDIKALTGTEVTFSKMPPYRAPQPVYPGNGGSEHG